MESIRVEDLDFLEDILEQGYWANGKNIQVDHLHQTGANSRFPKENIYGIYLADEQHAWMAFWMAVTDRELVRKRSLRYIASGGVGHLEVDSDAPGILRSQAYLYLFDPPQELARIDIRGIPNPDEAMRESGFEMREVIRHGVGQQNYFSPSPSIVHVDNWQLAITGIPEIYPDAELVLTRSLIEQVRDRVQRTADEIGENYLMRV
jgi:hypothetical protein